jgi:hypothetical protein
MMIRVEAGPRPPRRGHSDRGIVMKTIVVGTLVALVAGYLLLNLVGLL